MKTESKIQTEIVEWFQNNVPEQRGLLFAVNNNSHNQTKGAMNRQMGVYPGVSDLVYLRPSRRPVFLEVKELGGRQSKDQIKWEQQIESFGYEYFIVRSKQGFIDLFNAWNDPI